MTRLFVTEEGIAKFVERQDVEVPQDLVEAEYQRLLQEYVHRVQYGSFLAGSKLPSAEEQEETLRELQRIARLSIKTDLVMRKLIESEKITVSAEELEEEAQRISRQLGLPRKELSDFYDGDLSALRNDILIRKAGEFMCSEDGT